MQAPTICRSRGPWLKSQPTPDTETQGMLLQLLLHLLCLSLQNITSELQRIEPEKARRIQECEAFIESVPDTGSASLVKTKAEETNNKYNYVAQLLNAAQEK